MLGLRGGNPNSPGRAIADASPAGISSEIEKVASQIPNTIKDTNATCLPSEEATQIPPDAQLLTLHPPAYRQKSKVQKYRIR